MTLRWAAGDVAAHVVHHDIEPGTVVQVEGDPSAGIHVPAGFPGILCADAPFDSALGSSVDVLGAPDQLVAAGTDPVAAATLTQLLRTTSPLDTDAALVAESLAYATLQGGAEFGAWLGARGRRVRRDLDAPVIAVDETDEEVTITLDRPRLRNAFDARMRDALHEILEALLHDDRPIELRASGRAFCVGGDLAEFGTTRDTAAAHQLRMRANVAPVLAAVAHRVTARVHGACVGAGLELAAYAARVHARDDATFRLPEVTMGLVPGAGGTVSLPRRIGRQRTLWLALTDATIDAPTAHAWGLVDEIE